MYSAQLLDHFEHPRNPGQVENPSASAQIENPACGDVLKLTLRIEGERIMEARFLAKGCVPSMACASALTELVQGKTLTQARQLQREDVVNAVGGLPEASNHAAQLTMDALNAALKKASF
jgi:nitrogen fixation NifU-like protein